MSYANVVTDSMTPSTQNSIYESKKANSTKSSILSFDDYVKKNEDELDSFRTETGNKLLDEHPILLPTRENVRELSSYLEEQLDLFFSENSIPAKPPIEISMNHNTGEVIAKGDREDIDKINELLNSNEDMVNSINSVLAISSTYAALLECANFQQEYMDSPDPDAVVRKYSHLFDPNREHREATFMYGGSSSVLIDGMLLSDYEASMGVDEAKSEFSDEETEGKRDLGAFLVSIAEYIKENPDKFDIMDNNMRSLKTGAPLIMPSEKSIKSLEEHIKDELNKFFKENEIPVDPPVEISIDPASGKITVEGEREDIDKINELLHSNENAKETITMGLTVKQFWLNIQEDLEFQKEYIESGGAKEVVDKYAHLFSGEREFAKSSLAFDGKPSVQINTKEMNEMHNKFVERMRKSS